VFVLVACSLQFYIWVIYLLRVRYFGGIISKVSYLWRMGIFTTLFVFFGTLVPTVNVTTIIIEVFFPDLIHKVGSTIILYFIVISVIQFICFLITGSMLVHKLY
jgi:hypothetical protein